MTSRWDIEAAVWHSDLEPAARLLVLALLRKADNDTAVIPPEHSPSLSTLQAMTGLSRSAVVEWLHALDDAGWVKRTVPPKGSRVDRTRYALMIGSPSAQRRARNRSGPPRGLVRHADHSSPLSGPDLVRQADQTSPPGGPAPTYAPLTLPNTSHVEDPSASRIEPLEERADVEQVCQHLADRIEQNGSKRPTITKRWRTEARLLLDKDGCTVEQVITCIDWCQNHHFWHRNILSMPKLREKYERLRLDARAEQRGGGRGQLREHNGYLLKPETVANLERTRRMAALDANEGAQRAIEGTRR